MLIIVIVYTILITILIHTGADRHDLTGPGKIEFSGPHDHIQDLSK